LLEKVDAICEEAKVSKANMSPDKQDDGTFNLTSTNQKKAIDFDEESDIKMVYNW